MRNYGSVCILLMSLAFPACAGNNEALSQPESSSLTEGTETTSNPSGKSSPELPAKWEELTHNQWLDTLNISSCEAKDQGSESRRKNWIRLDDGTSLLLITCGLGAYQDAFHVYAVNTGVKTVKPVMLQAPQAEGESETGNVVRGSLYKSEQDETLELLHLSAATGACGWRALYPIEEVKRGGSVEPETLFGDEDCYNGVTVNDWPLVE